MASRMIAGRLSATRASGPGTRARMQPLMPRDRQSRQPASAGRPGPPRVERPRDAQ